MEDISPGGRGQPVAPVEGSSAQLRALGFPAVAQLLGMTLWFSAVSGGTHPDGRLGAVVVGHGLAHQLSSNRIRHWHVGERIFNLPDIVNSRYLFAVSALLGAATNAAFAFGAQDLGVGIPLRFMTGVFLAGV